MRVLVQDTPDDKLALSSGDNPSSNDEGIRPAASGSGDER